MYHLKRVIVNMQDWNCPMIVENDNRNRRRQSRLRVQIALRLALSFCLLVAFCVPLRSTFAQESCCQCCCDSAQTSNGPSIPNYGGCIWCRPNLTGNWHCKRTQLASNGITFDGNVTQYVQGVTSGGLDRTFDYGGHNDYVVNMDMGTLVGAKGMFLKLRGESQFGEFINNNTGALLAPNTSGLLPTPDGQETALTNFTITQMLSETFGLFAGKLDTMDGDLNAYAHGRGKDQFMNVGLVATPIAFRTAPYSTWGVGFMMLGAEGTPVFSFSAIDPRDFATTFNIDDIYEEGVTLVAELRLPTEFCCKPGHQLIGGIWSSRDVSLLAFAPLLLLPNVPLPQSTESWALYWNFDQQLFSNRCDRTKGWGVFGRAAIADEDTNPLEWYLSFGIGGNSPVPCRSEDTFGVGWFYAGVSDELPGLLLEDHGQGVELFYNFAVTPWMDVSPDLQIIDPARRNVDTSLLFGLRVKMTL